MFEAGARLFATRGFGPTTISDIAAAADVNRALVAYHFGSKGGLYDAILGEAVDHAAACLAQSAPDGDDYPELSLVRAFADVFSSRPHLPGMILREHLDPNHLLDPAAARKLRGFMALTERALEQIPRGSKAKRFDPQIVHLICIGPLVHFLVAQRQREATADATAVTTPGLDVFVETLAAILRNGLRDS
ncbi:MAG: TetR/AcrR family transcriptional regulator [Sphingomonas sp.]